MQQVRVERPVEVIVREIERRKRMMLVEVIELAEELTDNRGNAFELANRAIIRVAQKRRVEIEFRC
jgi:hypothetical protein